MQFKIVSLTVILAFASGALACAGQLASCNTAADCCDPTASCADPFGNSGSNPVCLHDGQPIIGLKRGEKGFQA